MIPELEQKVNLFVENRLAASKLFKVEYELNYVVSSLVMTGANKRIDSDKIKECKKILSSKAGIFSTFRSTCEIDVVTKMSLQNDPERYIDDVLEVYKTVRGKRIMEYAGLVLASMVIVDLGKKNEAEKITSRYEEILKKMSKKHPILTDENDIVFAVLLAMMDKDTDTIIDEMEECYTYLKNTLKVKADANALQGLSELLILSSGSITEKCDKAAVLFDTFREHGAKYGNYYEFASLAALIGLDMHKDELVDTIIEVEAMLKANKGFGNWSMDMKERLMFAAILVADVLSGEHDQLYDYAVGSAVINNTIAAIIAEEVAIMMCIVICLNSSSSTACT
jgi:hypothetical protein